jgi:hypothetical protein
MESNRLTAHHVTNAFRTSIIRQITEQLVDGDGNRVTVETPRVFLEKTPKNALRVPFFDRLFPTARFLLLWRDPRENISSIIEAWQSDRFRTYKELDGFDGPWSLLLPPGYRQLCNRPVEEIAAFQWECTNRILLDDLESLGSERWLYLSYSELISDPLAAVRRVLQFAQLPMDAALRAHLEKPLPHSRYTQTAPHAEKWRKNAAAIERVLPSVQSTWSRLETLPPRK